MKLACLIVLCLGCSTPRPSAREAEPSPPRAPIASVEICRTTEAELRAALGPPMRDGRLGRLRVQSWKLGSEPERIFAVILDARGTVVDLQWDAPGVVTWVPRDQCSDGGGS